MSSEKVDSLKITFDVGVGGKLHYMLTGCEMCANFKELEKYCTSRCPPAQNNASGRRYFWLDGSKDEIEVASEQDYRSFLRANDVKPLHLCVEEKKPPGKGAASAKGNAAVKANAPVHAGIICDVCDKTITGHRYKCLTCHNYDLCMSCEGKFRHKDHLMIRIPNPNMMNSSRVVLDRMAENFRNQEDPVLFPLFQAGEQGGAAKRAGVPDPKVSANDGNKCPNAPFGSSPGDNNTLSEELRIMDKITREFNSVVNMHMDMANETLKKQQAGEGAKNDQFPNGLVANAASAAMAASNMASQAAAAAASAIKQAGFGAPPASGGSGQNPKLAPAGSAQPSYSGGSSQEPKSGASFQPPQFGTMPQGPQYTSAIKQPQCSSTAQGPMCGNMAPGSQYNSPSRQPQYAIFPQGPLSNTTPGAAYASTAQGPNYRSTTQGPPNNGSMKQPQCGSSAQGPQYKGPTQGPGHGCSAPGDSTSNKPPQSSSSFAQAPVYGSSTQGPQYAQFGNSGYGLFYSSPTQGTVYNSSTPSGSSMQVPMYDSSCYNLVSVYNGNSTAGSMYNGANVIPVYATSTQRPYVYANCSEPLLYGSPSQGHMYHGQFQDSPYSSYWPRAQLYEAGSSAPQRLSSLVPLPYVTAADTVGPKGSVLEAGSPPDLTVEEKKSELRSILDKYTKGKEPYDLSVRANASQTESSAKVRYDWITAAESEWERFRKEGVSKVVRNTAGESKEQQPPTLKKLVCEVKTASSTGDKPKESDKDKDKDVVAAEVETPAVGEKLLEQAALESDAVVDSVPATPVVAENEREEEDGTIDEEDSSRGSTSSSPLLLDYDHEEESEGDPKGEKKDERKDDTKDESKDKSKDESKDESKDKSKDEKADESKDEKADEPKKESESKSPEKAWTLLDLPLEHDEEKLANVPLDAIAKLLGRDHLPVPVLPPQTPKLARVGEKGAKDEPKPSTSGTASGLNYEHLGKMLAKHMENTMGKRVVVLKQKASSTSGAVSKDKDKKASASGEREKPSRSEKASRNAKDMIVYSLRPNVNHAIHTMMIMGFSNQNGWLTQLLESLNGDIPKALDMLLQHRH